MNNSQRLLRQLKQVTKKKAKLQLPKLSEIRFQQETLKLENDLYEYLLWMFKEIKQEEFLENWHHRKIADVLMRVYRGEIKYLIITLPPRYTKTELVIKAFVSWCLAKNPKSKFIHLSYSDDLALDNSSAIKEIVTSDEYQSRWFMELKQDSQSKKKWFNLDGGGVYATATGGQITGFGAGAVNSEEFAGAILIDDPLKPDDAGSDTIRNRMNERFNNTIKSRVNSKHTPIILIMQRLHEDDMAGFLLGGGSEFDFYHLNLPAVNEDGKSEHDPREKGEALWKAKHDEVQLENMRVADAQTFAGQFQQRPAPAEGNIFKWFKFYTEIPKDIYFKCHSWDFTFKKSKQSDYVVGTNWGKTRDQDIYLIDLVRAKMSFTESLEAIKLFALKHPDYRAVLIEAKANGEAIIDSVKGIVKKTIPIAPTESKEERAEAVAPLFQAGDIYLPHPTIAPWVEDFINELKVFPNGKHDDQVDSATQAIKYLDDLGSMGKLSEAIRKQEPFSKSLQNPKRKPQSKFRVKRF